MALTETHRSSLEDSLMRYTAILNKNDYEVGQIPAKLEGPQQLFDLSGGRIFGWNTYKRLEGKSGRTWDGKTCLVGGIHNEELQVAYLGHFSQPIHWGEFTYNPRFIAFLHAARNELGSDARAIFRGLCPFPTLDEMPEVREGSTMAIEEYFTAPDIYWSKTILGMAGNNISFRCRENRLHVGQVMGIAPDFKHFCQWVKWYADWILKK